MRIIGGKYRSRRIHSSFEPKGSRKENIKGNIKGNTNGYRPTTDRARETIFNVLNNLIDFDSAAALDLFAGSGAIGFEFLSRGAATCDFVENSQKQIDNILKTSDELGCSESIEVFNDNVLSFLKRGNRKFYDIIFADPPYGYEYYNELVESVINIGFSIFVLEHAGESAGMYNLNDFDMIFKKAGKTNFTIFNKKE